MENPNIYKALNSVQDGNLQYVKNFVESGGNINEATNGTTLIIYTIVYNKLDILQYLVENGAETDSKDLVLAVENGRTQIMDYLLKNCPNIDVNHVDEKGNTILICALTMPNCFLRGDDHIDIIKCLIDNGADVNKKNNKFDSPMVKASYHHKFHNLDGRIVDLLISKGAVL
jgi:ankyrin repeat protein